VRRRASERSGTVDRRRFIVAATGCAAAASLGVSAPVTDDGDAALQSLRRGDLGASPFARIGVGSAPGRFISLTDDAVRLLRSGAPATHVGRMHAADDYHADLYSIDVREQARSFLLVRRGHVLTDIAAGWRSAPPPRQLRGTLAPIPRQPTEARNDLFASRRQWGGAVISALLIAARSAWPGYDADTGYSGGGSLIGPSYFALKAPPARWNRLSAARRAQILEALASAAARLSGLARPDAATGDMPMTVGIQPADPEPRSGRIMLAAGAGSYLAERRVAVHPWFLVADVNEVADLSLKGR
jgi:hypothetical protein